MHMGAVGRDGVRILYHVFLSNLLNGKSSITVRKEEFEQCDDVEVFEVFEVLQTA
jgi:hypothetical protein